ncbi:MAG: LacI family transcriptional regulator [Clostridiales bacterium]|nr:LacI family transcriptional regulator [Clostridiales bacterium]
MKDVAKHTGLSIATISKYINGGNVLDKNKKKIEDAIKTLDFRVNELARGLKTNRTMTVGVLILSLENIFFTSIISSVENVLLQYGYSTIICDCRSDLEIEKAKLDFLVSKKVDGIIMVPHGGDVVHIKKALDKNIPIVLIDRMLKNIECDVVISDNINAAYDAVEQFIIRGHRRIGIIAGPKKIYTTEERLKGYVRVHEDYAIGLDGNLIRYGNYDVESGYRILGELMEMDNPPTGIFVTNYEMTLGAIMAVNDKNIIIPDEVSLIGFDNIQMARVVKPPLSIVEQPVKGIGETAANVLLKRLSGENGGIPSIYRLKTEMLIKDSVKTIINQ